MLTQNQLYWFYRHNMHLCGPWRRKSASQKNQKQQILLTMKVEPLYGNRETKEGPYTHHQLASALNNYTLPSQRHHNDPEFHAQMRDHGPEWFKQKEESKRQLTEHIQKEREDLKRRALADKDKMSVWEYRKTLLMELDAKPLPKDNSLCADGETTMKQLARTLQQCRKSSLPVDQSYVEKLIATHPHWKFRKINGPYTLPPVYSEYA